MRCFTLALIAVLAGTGPAFACAVPTRFDLLNGTAQRVREVHVTEAPGPQRSSRQFNELPPGGLDPGAVATITLPSCMGRYDVLIVFADGSEQRHAAVDAQRIRGLTLR